MENKIKVLYHRDCLDGFSSAWVAWTVFGDKADYIPAVHEVKPFEFKNSDVYFLDFVYPKEIMDKFIAENDKVVVIDHHESEEETIKSIPGSTYSKDHSAAVLTWQYFYPKKDVPLFLKYIEDVDLWNLDMEHTMEVVAFLTLKEKEFNTWSKLVDDFEDEEELEKHLAKGKMIQKHKEFLTNRIVSKASKIKFKGHEVLAANTSVLVSDVGAKLYEENPPFSVMWYKGHGILKVSMRSNGDIDVSEIAKEYGGGGHPQAASFKLDINEDLPWEFLDDEAVNK